MRCRTYPHPLAFLFVAALGLLSVVSMTRGQAIGVVVEPDSDDGTFWITQVAPDGPAARAGVNAEDELLAVNGAAVAGKSFSDVAAMIKSASGPTLSLTVRAEDHPARTVTIQRSTVPANPNTPAKPVAPAAAVNDAAPRAAGSLKFTRVGINDAGINNLEAFSFLAPAGWRTEGGIKWLPDFSVLIATQVKVTDPQTGAQIEFLPLQNFTWLTRSVVPMRPGINYMGNIFYQPVTDLPTLIELYYAPSMLPQLKGIHPTATDDLPKVAQTIAAAYGGQSRVQARRIRYEYEREGRPWTEDVYLTTIYTDWNLGTLWSIASAYSIRAPKEQFDRLQPAMTAAVASVRVNREWYCGYMYVQKLFSDRMNNSIKNARALSDTITRNSNEIQQMFADSYRQRQESEDRISQNFSEYIRGVNTYSNPFESRQVELPSGYDNAWVNARGEYILTNQTGYDPNVGDTTEWRRMEARK